jgi:hypothetical protein
MLPASRRPSGLSAAAREALFLRLQSLFGLLLVVVSVAMVACVYLLYGREPPIDDPPAVVGAVIGQKPSVGIREFTATLFDLIRRGILKAQPVSVKQGNLPGEKTVSDIRVELEPYDPGSLDIFELRVRRRQLQRRGWRSMVAIGKLPHSPS